MYTSALIDLRQEAVWEPGRLTAQAFRWPIDAPLLPVRDLATRLSAHSVANAGAPVITSASIDPETGSIVRRSRTYQGAVFQVGSDLRVGDVLVPRGVRPAVLCSTISVGLLPGLLSYGE